MSLWIFVTIAAAGFQTVRFMLQKMLTTVRLSAAGATFARFAYSAPLMAVLLTGALVSMGRPLPPIGGAFWFWAVFGGLAQILATVCVVAPFKQRNFAVGVTFSKTDVIMTVFIGLAVLGDTVSAHGMAAILIGLVGVLLLSQAAEAGAGWWRGLSSQATLLGVGAGLFFALSAVAYRAAGLQVAAEEPVLRAAVSLAFVTAFQGLGMAGWLFWRDRGQLAAVWSARRTGLLVGLTSLAGSFCWFWAFSLQGAAYVRAVGQVELIFSLAASTLVFREPISRRELAGIAILSASIVLLVTLG